MKIGLDLGSTAIKIVFLEQNEIVWKKVVPTVPGQEKIANRLIEEGLAALRREKDQIEGAAVTGYGKTLFKDAHKTLDELTANALGAFHLNGGKACTVINIGGQDVKIINVDGSGKLTDFKMNDKCAAGTGRFFEVAGRILDTPIHAFGDLDAQAGVAAKINSTCTVFAESEIVSLLAQGVDKGRIVAGLHESVARRIASLAGSRDLLDEVYLDGGSAANTGLVAAVENELMRDIHVLANPQFTVAYGAAVSLFPQ